MTKNEIKKMVNTCNNYYSCALCPYNPEDISRFIGDMWKGGCPDYDRKLVYAMGKGYGNVSEYEAERKMLRSQIKVLKQRLKSQQQEIDGLKAENEELTKVVSSKVYDLIDNTKEIADAREAWEQQAKIDVLTELKKKYYGFCSCYSQGRGVKSLNETINEFIKEVLNAEDKS